MLLDAFVERRHNNVDITLSTFQPIFNQISTWSRRRVPEEEHIKVLSTKREICLLLNIGLRFLVVIDILQCRRTREVNKLCNILPISLSHGWYFH